MSAGNGSAKWSGLIIVIPAKRYIPLRADFEIRGRKFLSRALSLGAPRRPA